MNADCVTANRKSLFDSNSGSCQKGVSIAKLKKPGIVIIINILSKPRQFWILRSTS